MLPMYKKVAYGMGRFGSSLMLSLVGLTAFYIYGEHFELNWILDGIALATSYIVIGLTHWLTGYYSDSIDTRWGRRKPFVIVGAPGLAISGFLIYIPNWFMDTADPSNQLPLFGYVLLFLCLFKFFYAFLLTAFQAWMPEITDEDERPLVSSMQNTANWVANGIGLVFGFIVPLLFIETPSPGLSTLGFMIVLIFSVMIVLFYLPSIIFVREKPGIVIPERSLKDETKTILKNDVFVKFIFVMGFASFSFSAITTEIVGYANEVLLLTSIESLIPPAIALLISIIIFFYIWTKILKRIGKGRLYSYSYTALAILMFLSPVIGMLVGVISNVIVATIYFIPLAAFMAVHFIMSYVVPADIAHVDELKSGKSRAGIYEGFKGVPLNIFQAITGLSLGWLMEYSKVMTGSTYFGYLWFGPIFAPFLIISVLILRKTNIDPDFEALREESVIEE
jgi:GPH family glycoside/pentoside/hexuronide:cation symporter